MREYVSKRDEYTQRKDSAGDTRWYSDTSCPSDFLNENDRPYKGLTMKVGSEISKSFNVAMYAKKYDSVQNTRTRVSES